MTDVLGALLKGSSLSLPSHTFVTVSWRTWADVCAEVTMCLPSERLRFSFAASSPHSEFPNEASGSHTFPKFLLYRKGSGQEERHGSATRSS